MNTGVWMLLFWIAFGILLYTYLGYPLAIIVWSRLRTCPVKREVYEPSITVVMAVRNEEHTITKKISNLVSLDYPAEKISIVIVDDGSSDTTCALIQEAQNVYPERDIRLIPLEKPSGKPVALHRGVSDSISECILFCDARQHIEANALRVLASCFADQAVGAATGELHLDSQKGPGTYWRYERAIRRAEGNRDSVIGATGALYMIRRCLYRPFPPTIILDDVWMPMQIANQGYRVVFVPEAQVYDQEVELQQEFQRKSRTLAGNFQLLSLMPELLFPWSNRLFWSFFSHKLLRLLCPYALALLLLTSGVLAFTSLSWFWWGCFAGQVLFYLLAFWDMWGLFPLGRGARLAHTFVVLNWAAVVGFIRFLSGDFRWTR